MIPVDRQPSRTKPLNEAPNETIDGDAEALWVEEIRRRDTEIRTGTAKLKPLDQVLREAREVLRSLR